MEPCDAQYLQVTRFGDLLHECFEDKDHNGPHICGACNEQWTINKENDI